jgi:diguanylate cyclase (GGDEF)-like protein
MATNPFETLKASQRIPSPPGVVVRLLELVQSEDASLGDIAALIGSDPALAARVLRYARSPLIGFSCTGASIDEAVARIGMRGTQTIALSFSLISGNTMRVEAGFDSLAFWSRSLAVAAGCRVLARKQKRVEPEEAFLFGLLAHLGELLCTTSSLSEHAPLSGGGPIPDAAQLDRDRAATGTDRYELCANLLAHWRLPESIWRPIASLPLHLREDPRFTKTTLDERGALLRVACLVAEYLGKGAGRSSEALGHVVVAARAMLEMEETSLLEVVATTAEEWSALATILEVPASGTPSADELLAAASEYRDMLRVAADSEIESLRTENRQLAHLANRDRLTGLLNRRSFDAALSAMIGSSSDQRNRGCLLMMDLDHFKTVNDTYGHAVGDTVLQHVARVFSGLLSEQESPYRIGGEEFAVILGGEDRADGERLAESIRRAVCDTTVDTVRGTLRVSVSIGAAWVEECSGDSPTEELLSLADSRLYDAKRTGRNRCVTRARPTAQQTTSKPKSWTARLSKVFARI